MAFENGAPGILALQCKPAISRRTAETLLEAVDSNGDGGIQVSVGTNAERDDLYFPTLVLGSASLIQIQRLTYL